MPAGHLVARISWAERLGPGSVKDHSPFGERDFAGRWSRLLSPQASTGGKSGAPRIERIDGVDQIVVEADQVLSGIGLISNAGARFEAPETISAQGRFEDVHRGGYDPGQHLKDMALDAVAGEVLYPSQGLFYFKVADTLLMSAIFRAYNDWLAEFCRTDPTRLKGIAMINLDNVQDGIEDPPKRRPPW